MSKAKKRLSNWTIAVMFLGVQIIGLAFFDVHSALFEFRWIGFALLLPATALVALVRLPTGPTINIAGRLEFALAAPILLLANAAFWAVMVWYLRKRNPA